jgi:hypothetical protein
MHIQIQRDPLLFRQQGYTHNHKDHTQGYMLCQHVHLLSNLLEQIEPFCLQKLFYADHYQKFNMDTVCLQVENLI